MYTISAKLPPGFKQKHERYEFDLSNPPEYHRWVGETFSAVDSEMHPWDPNVVRRIRAEIEPDFVPIWVRSVYRSPAGSEAVFGRHAIGYMVRDPEVEHAGLKVLWPTTPGHVNYGFNRRGVLVIDPKGILEGERIEFDTGQVLPGEYVDFDWRAYYWLKARKYLLKSAEEEAREYIANKKDQAAKADAAMEAEVNYRWDHDWSFIKKNVEAMSGPEYDAMTHPREPEKKPFVHVKGAA